MTPDEWEQERRRLSELADVERKCVRHAVTGLDKSVARLELRAIERELLVHTLKGAVDRS